MQALLLQRAGCLPREAVSVKREGRKRWSGACLCVSSRSGGGDRLCLSGCSQLSPTCALCRGSLSGKPDDWPQDMKEYVERCFTACESEEDKDRTEKLLKEVLQARLQDGSAYTIDWSREPLPG